jgi:hypothetical protein
VDELLQASLAWQAWSIDKQVCNHCQFNKWAIWRCANCSLGSTLCQTCMCITHRPNPFHHIECWTGTHFCWAELWEVGTYLLVQHQTDQPICNALCFQMKYLETFEDMKDKAEQELPIGMPMISIGLLHQSLGPSAPDQIGIGITESIADETRADNETGGDTAFFDHLDALWQQGKGNVDVEDSLQDFFDGDDECEVEHANEDIHGFQPYLPHPLTGNETAEQCTRTDAKATIMLANANVLNNSYICVVHMNGIHHLAMVTCQCQGQHQIPLDLVTSDLLPTSFTKIHTLFTMQVLDHFWLCNLELKALAYQFYQLIWCT